MPLFSPSSGGGSGAVSEVDGQTGNVELTASDVGALPDSGGILTGPVTVTPVTLTDAATISVNAAASNTFKVTLGGNRTLASPTSSVDGQTITVEVIQDGTGSRTLAYGGAYQFPASIGTPVLSATAGARDFLAFRYNADDTTWWCVGFVPSQVAAAIASVSTGGTGQSALTAYALMAGGTTTTGAVQQLPAGTSGQPLLSGGSAALPGWGSVSGQYLAAPVQYAPGTATTLSTTSTTLGAVSSANVNTGTFTAPASGSVIVTATFTPTVTGSNNYSLALAAHGTVSPVLAGAVTLTLTSASLHPQQTLVFLVTGLTAGSTYNLDLLFATAGGTFSIVAYGQTSTTPTGTGGSPVIMTVQAV
jgi:hypothetical protein